MIRDSCQQYAQEKLLPRITEANRKGTFDRDIIKEMGRTMRTSSKNISMFSDNLC